jgi:hypothetical protein
MDSTHNTNKLKWYLSTLMVQDSYYNWIPAVFFLHNNADADILATVLIQAKKWYGSWHLHYMLTDDSAGEQSAIKKAF